MWEAQEWPLLSGKKKKKERDLKTNPPTPTPSLNQQPQLQIAHRSPKQFRVSQVAFLFHSHSTLTPQDAQKDIPAALLQFSTAFWKASEIRTNRSWFQGRAGRSSVPPQMAKTGPKQDGSTPKPPHCWSNPLLPFCQCWNYRRVAAHGAPSKSVNITSPLNKRPRLIEYKFVFIEAAVTWPYF